MPGKQKIFPLPFASCLVVNEVSVAIKTSSKVEREQRKSYNTRQLLSLFLFYIEWQSMISRGKSRTKEDHISIKNTNWIRFANVMMLLNFFFLLITAHCSKPQFWLKNIVNLNMRKSIAFISRFWRKITLFSRWIFKKSKILILPQCVERILTAP